MSVRYKSSVNFTAADELNISTVRQYMRRRGSQRVKAGITDIVRFALNYAALAIKAERRGDDEVQPPPIPGDQQED